MKYLILPLTLILAGCISIPQNRNFPNPYSVGLEKSEPACPDLFVQEGDNVPITTFLTTVSNNYKLYYDCKAHVDNWNKWYKEQKENFNKANE